MRNKKKVISTSILPYHGRQVEIRLKHIKNMYLRVYPAKGKIVVSAPAGLKPEKIESFIRSKKDWIDQYLNEKSNILSLDSLDVKEGAMVPVWGEQKRIVVDFQSRRAADVDKGGNLKLVLRRNEGSKQARRLLLGFYRREMKMSIPPYISFYEDRMKVNVAEFGIKKMKTRWGSCNTRAHRIWLNLELALYPPEIMEYVLVHEMVHLHERLHNRRFYRLMDQFLPDWKSREKELKRGLNSC
jgi:predicted metal-dependent hydrolase